MVYTLPRVKVVVSDNNISEVSKSYFVRRVDDKLSQLDQVTSNNHEQGERIEIAFSEHMCRQVGLVADIKESLNHFITTVEETIKQELSRIRRNNNNNKGGK